METVKRLSGSKFREKVHFNGKLILSPWFSRKSDAKAWKSLKVAEKLKSSQGLSLDDTITTDSLFEKFIASRQDRAKRTLESYQSTYKVHVRPVLGHLPLRVIRVHHGEAIKQNFHKLGLSASRGNDVLIQLKGLFNFAVRQQHLGVNPFKNLDPLKQHKKEIIYWNQVEVDQFLSSSINDRFYPLYVLLLNTGLRKSEACGLMWDCVDFDQKIITVKRTRDREGLRETTKGGESRKVPMNIPTHEALLKVFQTRVHPSFVFCKANGEPISYEHLTDRLFRAAVKRAGVRQIRLHDLRTTFASHFCINNGNVFVLSKILGHKSVNITQKFYAEINNDFLNSGAETVSFGRSHMNSSNVVFINDEQNLRSLAPN
jgi:integrase